MQNKTPNIQAYTPNAWLLTWETKSADFIHHLSQQLKNHSIVKDITLGANSLLIQTTNSIPKYEIQKIITTLTATQNSKESSKPNHHNIQVTYDGPDLKEISDSLLISENEIINLHTAPIYKVRFLGFSPGFPYLEGLHPTLHIPRRSSPRTHIKKGAVAIANGYTSIYTIPSPGGWNWLGNTEYSIFEPEKNNETAFKLKSGDTLKFIST